MRRLLVAVLGLLSALATQPAQARIDIIGVDREVRNENDRDDDRARTPFSNVRTIGKTQLADWDDSDTIYVSSCEGRDKVFASALRVTVKNESAHLEKVVVTYGNGERDQLEIREHFRQNSSSRWVDLNGSVRCIRSIRVVGEASGRGWPQPATVIVQAMTNERDNDMDNPVFVRELGTTDLKDFSRDSDILQVSNCTREAQRNISAIKLLVTRDAARIDHLRVTYGNGAREELAVRSRFEAGSTSRWINLSGNLRCIRTVQIVGEAIGPASGRQSRITVLGMVH